MGNMRLFIRVAKALKSNLQERRFILSISLYAEDVLYTKSTAEYARPIMFI